MKRRRRSNAAPQAEACGVWLDTAELKRSAAQSLIAKPKVSSQVLERKHAWVASTQPGASQPRTKQTTISAFFSTQTDEKDKENSRPSPFIPKKDCKEEGISVAVYPVKILALLRMEGAQEESVPLTPQRRPQKPPASPIPLPDSSSLQAESHSETKASCGAGEDCCSFSFTQDSEGTRIIAHRNGSDLFTGDTVTASGSVRSGCGINRREGRLHLGEVKTGLDFQPRSGAKQNKKPQQSSSVHSVIDFTDTENINPAIMRDRTWAVSFYSPPHSPGGARPLRERSQNAGAAAAEVGRGSTRGLSSPCRDLFTQDSEGNRVIAHRCPSVPSPRKDDGSSGWRLPEGSPSAAANRSLSKVGEQLDVCCEFLFTQDSEGNRVIKHWILEVQIYSFPRLSSGHHCLLHISCREDVLG